MVSSLLILVNNLSEGIQIIKSKFGHDDKKCETYGIKYKYCNCFLDYVNFKDDLIECRCLCFNKNYQHKLDEKIKERFFLTMTIISLLYCFKKMFTLINIWIIGKISMKHHYLKKRLLQSLKYGRYNWYEPGKRVGKGFQIKSLGEYHDFYV